MSTSAHASSRQHLDPLAACGADDIASPGDGVLMCRRLRPTAPAPDSHSSPPPTGGPFTGQTPAGFIDRGVIGNRRVFEMRRASRRTRSPEPAGRGLPDQRTGQSGYGRRRRRRCAGRAICHPHDSPGVIVVVRPTTLPTRRERGSAHQRGRARPRSRSSSPPTISSPAPSPTPARACGAGSFCSAEARSPIVTRRCRAARSDASR
jgi:hypothetical protein